MDSSFAGLPASSFSESLARRGMSLRLETTISGSRQTMRISFIRIAAETLPLAPTLATRKNATFAADVAVKTPVRSAIHLSSGPSRLLPGNHESASYAAPSGFEVEPWLQEALEAS